MTKVIVLPIMIIICMLPFLAGLELGGLSIFIKPNGIEKAMTSQNLEDLNMTFKFESSILKSAVIRSLYTGDKVEASRTDNQNEIKIKFFQPIAVVEIESSILSFLQKDTTDYLTIHFDFLAIVLDTSKKDKKLVSSVNVFVNKIEDKSNNSSPTKRMVFDLLTRDGLDIFLNSQASLQMLGQKLAAVLYKKNEKEMSDGLFSNLSSIDRLKLISMSNNSRFETCFAADGTFFHSNSKIKSINKSSLKGFKLPDYQKDIAIAISEHTIETALQSKLELNGGLNYTTSESGSKVTIKSIANKPLKVIIDVGGLILIKTLNVEIMYKSIVRSTEIETKSKIVPKIEGNFLVFQIEDIDYDDRAISNLIRIPFYDPSPIINSLIKSNLKKSVKSPAIDIQAVEISAAKGKFKFIDRQIELTKGFILMLYNIETNQTSIN